ncbi:MAG: FAD-binding oxidoreductase [Zestosphaera sp.]
MLVVGAGVSGLFAAYELRKRGVDVVAVDASYPGSGASMRNLGCFRSSFTSPEHVTLMKESIKEWLGLRDEMGIELEQCGYLWIARRDETLSTFRRLAEFYHQFSIPAEILDADEVKDVEPMVNTRLVAGAMRDPTAGMMPMLKNFVKIYLKVKGSGVRILPYTKVLKLLVSGGRVVAAETGRGVIEADVFLVAAGGDSREIVKTVGIDLPIVDVPRHPFVTEPYSRGVIRSGLLIDWDTPGSPHIRQTEDGNFILARDLEDVAGASIYSQRADAITHILKPLTELLPFLSKVNILRYWMGYYDMTPDHHPIYGPLHPYENLYVAAGFSGHGMMLGPVTGKLMSSWILDGRPYIDVANNLTLERFKLGKLVRELAVIG